MNNKQLFYREGNWNTRAGAPPDIRVSLELAYHENQAANLDIVFGQERMTRKSIGLSSIECRELANKLLEAAEWGEEQGRIQGRS